MVLSIVIAGLHPILSGVDLLVILPAIFPADGVAFVIVCSGAAKPKTSEDSTHTVRNSYGSSGALNVSVSFTNLATPEPTIATLP